MGELTSTLVYGKGANREIRSLQNFAAQVLKDRKARGVKYDFGKINRVVERELRKRGKSLESDKVITRDDTILKYENHPKATKGAVLPAKKYYMLDKLIRKPTHIYVDTSKQEPVFIYSTRYSSGKVLKAVVHVNYKANKTTFNFLKSVGIVDKKNMKEKQFKKIK